MKLCHSLLISLLGTALSAQIHNGSFENWSDTSGNYLPVGWQHKTDPPMQDSMARQGNYAILFKPEGLLDSYTMPNLTQYFPGVNGANDTLYFWLNASDTLKRGQYLAFRFLSKGYQSQDTVQWYLTDTFTQGYALFKIPLTFSQKPLEVRLDFWLYTAITTKNPRAVRVDAISLNQNPLGLERKRDVHVAVYPVPVKSYLHLKGLADTPVKKVMFYNLQGQIFSAPRAPSDGLSVAHLPAGLYFIEIQLANRRSVRRKFLKK